MKILTGIKVEVREPFSGGKLTMRAGEVQICPAIVLPEVQTPSYVGVSRSLAAWDKAHRAKEGYIAVYDGLMYPYEGKLSFEIQGKPKSSVKVTFLQ